MSYGQLTKENKLVVARCPVCDYFEVISKDWFSCVGSRVSLHCDSCLDNDIMVEKYIFSASLDNFVKKD